MSAAILVSGMFDLDNYGDLLFPLIAARRLAICGYRTVPVAPSATRAALLDAMPPSDIAQLFGDDEPIAGILVGGGYIIHASSMEFLENYHADGIDAWCGAGLWLGATLAAALRDVPIAWNAPGVPHPFSARQRELAHAAVRAASYVAVRDRGSARLLAAPPDASVRVVPDPIVELAQMWPRATLADTYRDLLQRKNIRPDARLLAVHVRNRSRAGLSDASLGEMLGNFAKTHDLVPMLIAVAAGHDDPAVARRLAPHIGQAAVLLDDPLSLREITAALAHSVLYVGASLHGYIAAAAYGIQGVLVARPAYHKFSGFLEHLGRMQDLARDWPEGLQLAAAHCNEVRCHQIPSSVFAALDAHWASVNVAMRDPADHRGARHAFALALLRHGIRTDGPGWAVRPIMNRLMRGSAVAGRRRVAFGNPEEIRDGQPAAN
jgi:hypothetical protein